MTIAYTSDIACAWYGKAKGLLNGRQSSDDNDISNEVIRIRSAFRYKIKQANMRPSIATTMF